MLVVADLLDDWETGARGGQDYWGVAGKMVRQRHAAGAGCASSHPLMFNPGLICGLPANSAVVLLERSEEILERITLIESKLERTRQHTPHVSHRRYIFIMGPIIVLGLVQLRQQVEVLMQSAALLKHLLGAE